MGTTRINKLIILLQTLVKAVGGWKACMTRRVKSLSPWKVTFFLPFFFLIFIRGHTCLGAWMRKQSPMRDGHTVIPSPLLLPHFRIWGMHATCAWHVFKAVRSGSWTTQSATWAPDALTLMPPAGWQILFSKHPQSSHYLWEMLLQSASSNMWWSCRSFPNY